MPDGPSGRRTLPDWLVLALLALAFSLPSIATRDLWNPDEPRYAEVAREMRVLGDYLVPHLNGTIYAEKPPLFFWLSALLQSLGFGFASGRIVVAGAAVGCLLLTSALARLWFSREVGLAAGLILGSTVLFTWISKMGVLDVPLTFFTLLAVYGWFRHRRDGGAWSLLLFTGMGLATLVKGPVGILIPALAVVATHLVPGSPAPRSRHLAWGALITVGIVAAWVVPACLSGGPEYAQTILFRQNVGRMVTSWSHRQPWHYYLAGLPWMLFPWIVFVPWAIARLWAKGRAVGDGTPRRLILWFGLGLVVFSLISGKRGRYLIPFLPPLAIVLAVFFEDVLRSIRDGALRDWMKRLIVLQHGLFVLIGALLVGLPLLAEDLVASARPGWERGPEAMGDLTGDIGPARLAVCGAALLAVGAAGWLLARRLRYQRALAAILAGALVLSVSFDLLLTPGLNELKSGRQVGVRINELAPPDGPGRVALFLNVYSGVYNLYTGRLHMPVLEDAAGVDRFLSESDANLVVTHRNGYERFGAAISAPHRVIEASDVGHRTILFLVPE